MNVTLVKFPLAFSLAPPKQDLPFWNLPPLGLLSLAGSIKDQVDKVKIIDMSVGNVLDEKTILNSDILGVGPVSRDFPATLSLLKKAKEINPHIKTVVGGWHISLYQEDIDKEFIDHFVIGEGEIAFNKIINGEAKSKILQEPFIKNMDDIPYPYYDLVNVSKYHFCHLTNAYAFEFSRGCSFNCSYCSIRKFYGRTYRTKSIERVINELQYFNPKFAFFVDDNFAVNVNKTKQLCEGMIDFSLDRSLYATQLRVDMVDKHPEVVEKMADAGFSIILLGIESPLKKSLEAYKKNISWEQTKRAKRILDDNGMLIVGQLMIGSLGETEKDIRKYCKMIRTLDLDLFQLSLLTPLPGTDFFQDTEDKNIRFLKDWKYYDCTCCVFQHPNIDFRRLHHLFMESYIRLVYDPISTVKRIFKMIKFYKENRKIIDDLLDFNAFLKSLCWELPKFLFWSSNQSIRNVNKYFTSKLKESIT